MTTSATRESPVAARRRSLAALATGTFDLLVIGGGINGAGIARDAVLRGLTVALVDKGDFASGTSSKSTKLVHGGLRYLEQGHVRLVFESVNERARLTRLAPHLVRPLEFLLPSYRGDRPGLFVMDCGLWIYDALSGFSSPKMHRTYRRGRVAKMEPALRQDGLRGGIVYYDCATDDARLTIENIIDAQAHGAVTLNHVRAVRLMKDGDRFVGAEVQEGPHGALIPVRAKVVINATGPWCDELRQLYGAAPILGPTKGVHLIVDAKRLPLGRALLVKEKKRVVFLIPWGARSVIGTTDTFYTGNPEDAQADRADIDYLLAVGNHYFPESKLVVDDVLATYSGLRPLLRPPNGEEASSVSREHHLESAPGLVTIAGGKLTTYRVMASEVVDRAGEQLGNDKPSVTGERPLPGAIGGAKEIENLYSTLVEGRRCEYPDEKGPALARHLTDTYGVRAIHPVRRIAADPALRERIDPELPYVFAEVDLAVEDELALHIADVLERRIPLLLRSRDQGLAAAPRVADRMGALLGWDAARRELELDRYRATVAATRRYRA